MGAFRRSPLERVWAMLLAAHKALPLLAMMVRKVVKGIMALELRNENGDLNEVHRSAMVLHNLSFMYHTVMDP